MDLTLLAPYIQEEILGLPLVASGKEDLLEKELRAIARVFGWYKQREMWTRLQKFWFNS